MGISLSSMFRGSLQPPPVLPQPSSVPTQILHKPDETKIWKSLVDDQPVYTIPEVRRMLRRDPMFATLDSRRAYRKASKIAHQLKRLGKTITKAEPSISRPVRRRRQLLLASAHLDQASARSLQALKRMYKAPQQHWLIDTEFQSLVSGTSALAFSICIRDFHGRELISTTINYGMTMEELWLQVAHYMTKNPDRSLQGLSFRRRMFEDGFQRVYRGSTTHGMNIEQIRSYILRLNASQKYRLVSWHSSVDICIFNRIMVGDDRPVVAAQPGSPYLNVARLCRKMLRTKVGSMALAKLHPRLCPQSPITTFHQADTDCRALAQIIKVMVKTA